LLASGHATRALRPRLLASRDVELEFQHDGERGRVVITCVPNDDPASVGKSGAGRDFPVCTATIEYSGRGYRALFGWVQLVRSTDNASGGRAFEMDPFNLFEDALSPYCWFGITPTLFDAPSRDERTGSQLPRGNAPEREAEGDRTVAGLLVGL
jgi:hypothetical protein